MLKSPKFLIEGALSIVRTSVQNRAKFDIYQVQPNKDLHKCFVPAMIVHGVDDTLIFPHHSDQIYAAYAGDKKRIRLPGDHNDERSQEFIDEVVQFFRLALQVDSLTELLTEEQWQDWEQRKLSRIQSYALIPKLENPYKLIGVSGVFN